jgi:GNAT superfamily N-acetyltransferase
MRAEVWGTCDGWCERLSAYLAGTASPRFALSDRVVRVAVAGGAPAGFIAGHLTRRFDCQGELQWINVARAHRRFGIASELLRWLAGWFLRHDARRVCVNVEPDNAAARTFYTRHCAEPLGSHWLVWSDIAVVLDSCSRDAGEGPTDLSSRDSPHK